MLKPISLNIEGFGVIQSPFALELNTEVITLIKARNGKGKTTIFSALTWAIYGKTLKDINQDKIPTWKKTRSPSFRGTQVIFNFIVGTDKYTIARQLNFKGTTITRVYSTPASDLTIWKNEEELTEYRGNINTQSFINKLVGLSYDTFIKSVLFGQKMKRLIEESDKDLREFFDEVFDQSWVDQAKDKAKLLLSETFLEAQAIRTEYDKIVTTISTVNLRIDDAERNITEENVRKAFKVEHNELAISMYNEDIELNTLNATVTKNLEDNAIKEIATEQARINSISTGSEHKISTLKSQIVDIDTKTNNLAIKLNAMYEDIGREKKLLDLEQIQLNQGLEAAIATMTFSNMSLSAAFRQELLKIEFDKGIKTTAMSELTHEMRAKAAEMQTQRKLLSDIKTAILNNPDVCPACLQKMPEDRLVQIEHYHKSVITTQIAIDLLTTESIALNITYDSLLNEVDTLQLAIEATNTKIVEAGHKLAQEQAAEKAKPTYLANPFKLNVVTDSYNLDYQEYNRVKLESKEDKEILQDQINALANPETDELKLLTAKLETLTKATIAHVESLATIRSNIAALVTENAALVLPDTDKDFGKKGLQASLPGLLVKQQEQETLLMPKVKKCEALQLLVDKVFTNTGVKSNVFQASLFLLNDSINTYANKFGINVTISVDITKARSPISTAVNYKGNEVTYEELSGGEQQRVNLCIAFGCYVMIAEKTIPLMVMDEVFEGLDQEGVDMASSMVRTVAVNKSVFLITHHQGFNIVNAKILEL